jgi:hypothetical protein
MHTKTGFPDNENCLDLHVYWSFRPSDGAEGEAFAMETGTYLRPTVKILTQIHAHRGITMFLLQNQGRTIGNLN